MTDPVPQVPVAIQMSSAFEGRSVNEYLSRDSAPPLFTTPVPLYLAPVCLVLFSALVIALLWLVNVYPPTAQVFPYDTLIVAPAEGEHTVPVRIFIISFMLAFSLTAALEWRTKILMGLDMAVTFASFCLLIDIILTTFDLLIDYRLPLRAIELFSGLVGFGLYTIKLLEWGHMPAPVSVELRTAGYAGAVLLIALAASVAIVFSLTLLALFPREVTGARELALLGGLGPGLFLVFPAFFIQLYVLSWIGFRLRREKDFAPDLTVLIPALNEEYIVGHTLAALDRSAAGYRGRVKVVFVDNGSTDATVATVAAALDSAAHLTGEILHQPLAGKSRALNLGLERIETEFFVRIDADTLVRPDTLAKAASMLARRDVGVVGGIPLPPGSGMFDNVRAIEVYVRHGFYNVAYDIIDGVVSVPGMFALYRTELPKKLGGFVFGMNGEDTDMSFRIGELGYRLIVSPKVLYHSEVPVTYRHLREQRLRWFRSTLHITSRLRDLLYGPHFTVRSKLILPFMLMNLARRAMMLPLILFGLICLLPGLSRFDTISWYMILATFIGAPAVISILACLLNRDPLRLLHLPAYLLFRLLRSYLTLESMMTIRFRPSGRNLYSREALSERDRIPRWMA